MNNNTFIIASRAYFQHSSDTRAHTADTMFVTMPTSQMLHACATLGVGPSIIPRTPDHAKHYFYRCVAIEGIAIIS